MAPVVQNVSVEWQHLTFLMICTDGTDAASSGTPGLTHCSYCCVELNASLHPAGNHITVCRSCTCNVLQHHMQSNVRQCSPCTAHQQKKMAEGKTTARPEASIYDTIHAVRLPVVLLVSVWSLQASSSCVHCKHFRNAFP